MKRLAILPGSFDPMTLGHLELAQAAAKEFEHLVIAVMINREKQTLFSPRSALKSPNGPLGNSRRQRSSLTAAC